MRSSMWRHSQLVVTLICLFTLSSTGCKSMSGLAFWKGSADDTAIASSSMPQPPSRSLQPSSAGDSQGGAEVSSGYEFVASSPNNNEGFDSRSASMGQYSPKQSDTYTYQAPNQGVSIQGTATRQPYASSPSSNLTSNSIPGQRTQNQFSSQYGSNTAGAGAYVPNNTPPANSSFASSPGTSSYGSTNFGNRAAVNPNAASGFVPTGQTSTGQVSPSQYGANRQNGFTDQYHSQPGLGTATGQGAQPYQSGTSGAAATTATAPSYGSTGYGSTNYGSTGAAAPSLPSSLENPSSYKPWNESGSTTGVSTPTTSSPYGSSPSGIAPSGGSFNPSSY